MTAAPAAPLSSEQPILRIEPPNRWWAPALDELWTHRELAYFFVWRDVKIRYKQTLIGAGWAVLQPFLAMLVFTLLGRSAGLPSDSSPYPLFYYSALLPWMYFATSLQNATNTMVENQRVITKVYFPRLVLPLSAVLSGLVDFSISLLMFVAMMVYYRVPPSPALLWLPFFLLLAVCTALGFGLWLGALNAIYRDVRYVVPFLIEFWMLVSVVIPGSHVPAKWRWAYELNPMAGVIEGFRWSLMRNGSLPGRSILVSTVLVLIVLVTGWAYFQKMETTIADVA
ncbi:MAG TPA: ABC transporter permease [Candidatus Acidoferrales bacterium]|nr:ABC transporter permease [Candidatus Acidoferrales bacterium]